MMKSGECVARSPAVAEDSAASPALLRASVPVSASVVFTGEEIIVWFNIRKKK